MPIDVTDHHERALRCVHAARMVECAASVVCGTEGGRFLSALASGANSCWPIESSARSFALKLRAEVIELLGGEDDANDLLRLLTRHGRLYPGLAPPISGTVVSSERGDTSSPQELCPNI